MASSEGRAVAGACDAGSILVKCLLIPPPAPNFHDVNIVFIFKYPKCTHFPLQLGPISLLRRQPFKC